MKILSILLALLLTLSLSPAQTDSTNPAPTATATPPPAAKRLPFVDKVPPNMPETRNADWEKRALATTAKAKADAASIELVFDGDSITDFWQTKGLGLDVYTERYGKFHPADFAISGDTTQNLLWRLAHGQAEGLHPKLIVLMIGTNNTKSANTPEEIASGVKEIIAQYQKICPEAVILLQAVFPRGAKPTDPKRIEVKAINEFISKFGDGTKVVYIDFGDKFLAPDGTLTKEIMPDTLHPSAKGYQIWADAIQPAIDKYLPAK